MPEIITLETKNGKAEIYAGKLVGFEQKGIKYIHGGGKPDSRKRPEDKNGWQDSEIIMFPIVGAAVGSKVTIKDTEIKQAKHGVSQFLPFVKEKQTPNYIQFVQQHDGESPINGPENPRWPFEFEIRKSIKLTDTELKINISLTNKSKQEMPYMLGFHPAFKMLGSPNYAVFIDSGKRYEMEDIVKESEEIGAFFLKGVTKIAYQNGNNGFEFLSWNFNDMMIWSPDINSGMFCVEPLTNLPMKEPEERKHFLDRKQYQVIVSGETKEYRVVIRPSGE